jgi:predicted transcriptional regulator of viral defense system
MEQMIKRFETVPTFLDYLQKRGILCFSKADAMSYIDVTAAALYLALHRQAIKGRIRRIYKDFYIIVPVEYQEVGAIPPEWFIDQLMKFMKVKYYVGLLSAASLHGAAHQQPMKFQVITEGRHFQDIRAGKAHINFISKNHVPDVGIENKKSIAGYFNVSGPELTMFDLVRYPSSSGQWNNIATIASELALNVNPAVLIAVAKASTSGRREMIYWQRLGYIMDFIGAGNKVDSLSKWIRKNNASPGYLVFSSTEETLMKDDRWNLYINAKLEPDL